MSDYARAAAIIAQLPPDDDGALDTARTTVAELVNGDTHARGAVRAVAVADRRRSWQESDTEACRIVDAALGIDGPEWPDVPNVPGPPEPDRVPVDVLPPSLRDHVQSVAATTQTPPELATLMGLAAVSTAVRGRADVTVPDRGWREVVTVYVVALLPPATRKSPVFRHMVGPLEAWERDALDRLRPGWRRARDRVEVARRSLESTIRATSTNPTTTADELEAARRALDDAEEAVPTLPRLMAADATPEALVRLMAEQGGPLGLLAPEGDPFGVADGRYTDAARMDELLRAWGGESIRVDRANRDPVHVDRPVLTMGITMQPAVLDTLRHARAFRGRGLMGRILWACPPHGLGSRLTGRDVPPLDHAAADRYAAVLHHLLDATVGAGGADPVALSLTADATTAIYDYEAEIERELADRGRLAGIRDHAGKIVGQAIRLAALLEIAARAEDGRPLWTAPIGTWAAEGGIRLARALTSHALAVLSDLEMDRRTADQRYVLRRAGDLELGSTLRDLHRATADRPGLETMEDLEPVVAALVERGCIRLIDQAKDGPGRPPSPVVEVHPDILDPFTNRPRQNRQNPTDGEDAGSSVGSVRAYPGEGPDTPAVPDDVFSDASGDGGEVDR